VTGADGRAPTLFVVGAGRAGLGIACAVRAGGGRVVGVHGRRPVVAPAAGPVSHGALPAALGEAEIVLVAVRDRELDGAIESLRGRLAAGAVVLQASGSAEPRAYDLLRADGVACGTFHPLVPLAEAAHAPELLRGAWVGVDGDAPAESAARALAACVGAHVLRIPAGEKARYHAAAVFASNFPTVLAAIAEHLMRQAGIDEAEAGPAVRHLLSSAAANLARGHTGAALTGPIVRGDAVTVRAHLDALADDAIAREAYVALSRAAIALVGGVVAPDVLAPVRDVIG
jgi:predicted short-subunit dehydrogenase-like oxidoreductase (DUF2520 family)